MSKQEQTEFNVGPKQLSSFIQINESILGFDDGATIHLLYRDSVLKSLRLMVLPGTREKRPDGTVRYRPYYDVVASFTGLNVRTGEDHTFSYAQKVKTLKKAIVARDEVICLLAGNDLRMRDVPSIVKRSILSRSLRWLRNTMLATVAAIGILIVAASFIKVPVPIDPNEVKAWGTERMQPWGALAEKEMNILKDAAEIAGFDLTDSEFGPAKDAIPFYVMTRLDCDECASIEHALPSVSTEYSPVLLPVKVAESDMAMMGAAHTYCSDTPTATWLTISITGKLPVESPACDDWVHKVSAAQLAYTMAGLDDPTMPAFPAIIAPNGAVFSGSLDSVEFEERGEAITEWLRANTKDKP